MRVKNGGALHLLKDMMVVWTMMVIMLRRDRRAWEASTNNLHNRL